jgi:hypothetical protein
MTAAIESVFQRIPFSSLVTGFNPRLPENYDTENMYADIRQNGLLTPIRVFQPNGNDQYQIICGNRRYAGIGLLQERDANRFTELFGDGIPVEVRVGITPEQAMVEVLDEGNSQPLSNRQELQYCADVLFEQGATDAEVSNKLQGLMERIMNPLSGARKKKIADLHEQVKAYRHIGNIIKADEAEKDIAKEIAEARRGCTQHLRNVWRCPQIVYWAEFLKHTGRRPDETPEDVYLPDKLTVTQVTKLAKKLDQDIEESKDADQPYSKELPGPNFDQLWNELVENDKANKNKEPTKRKKSRSHDEISSQGLTATSNGMKQVCRFHAGEVEAIDFKSADALLFVAELVSKHDKKLWSKVQKRADEIKAELNAKREEVTPAPEK